MGDEEGDEPIANREYPGGRVGLGARVIKMQEEDAVIIEEINHGYINDGYDEYLYEDNGLTKEELQESTEVTCCMMDCIWYVIFRFCRCDQIEEMSAGRDFDETDR